MDEQNKAPASVTAAGIVAIVGSLLVLFGGLMGFLGLQISPATNGRRLSPAVMTMAESMLGCIIVLGVLGIATGVGLFRLRNWARISTLIWSGITVVFCVLVIGLLAITPFPTQPNAAMNPGVVRVLGQIFYAVPLAIGIWWLILFNSKSVAAQFRQSVPARVDDSGFPSEVESMPKSQCPLPVMTIGAFLVLSSLCVLFIFFFPAPVLLFGHPVRGLAGIVVWLAFCVMGGAAGIGLLQVKPWGYWLALGLQVFWLLSGPVTLMSSKYPEYMREVLTRTQERLGVSSSSYSVEQVRPYAFVGLLAPLLIAALLTFYRTRFFEAAQWRGRSDSSPFPK